LQARYSAIEQSYNQQQWSQVETLSLELLADLPPEPGDPLRQRLQLLLAHTQLYGNADPVSAANLYGAVAQSVPEPALLTIAEQGLEYCNTLIADLNQRSKRAAPANADAATDPGLNPALAASPTGAQANAMPWLETLGNAGVVQPQHADPLPAEQAAAVEANPALTDGEAEPTSPARAETLAMPLRWPFMAGHVEAPAPSTAFPSHEPAPAKGTEPLRSQEREDSRSDPRVDEPDAPLESAAPAATVEVVEEPEQIAVALADPDQRNTITVEVGEAGSAWALAGPDLTHQELAELSKGLLRVVIAADPG